MTLPFDSEKLRYFVPLAEISPDNFNDLVKNISIEILEKDKHLFTIGENDNFTYYLLSGEIILTDAESNTSTLSSKSKKCRFPIEHHSPRQVSAISKTDLHYFKIDNDLLDVLLTWDQNKNYIVSEIGEDANNNSEHDWMTQILQHELFHKIPPANIQAIFQRMQSVPVNKDDVIIKQGDEGDFFYFIKSGSCRVIRNAAETGYKELKIANIEEGNGFGEDALLSNVPRNASVIMNTNGSLMRLAKDDFLTLLKEPIIKSVTCEEAKQMTKQGALWLDVRLQSEHQNKNIPNSINIPLFLLRLNADKLSHDHKYIIYCDTGSRSSSAAFILNEHGYDAYLLQGGLNAMNAKNVA